MNIIIHGSTGRMGRKLQELLAGNAAHTMVAAVSPEEDVLKTLNDYQGPADLIIDFSFHGAVYDLMDYAEAKKLPVVVATTGYSRVLFRQYVRGCGAAGAACQADGADLPQR